MKKERKKERNKQINRQIDKFIDESKSREYHFVQHLR